MIQAWITRRNSPLFQPNPNDFQARVWSGSQNRDQGWKRANSLISQYGMFPQTRIYLARLHRETDLRIRAVIPVYNEEEGIDEPSSTLEAPLERIHPDYEAIFI